MAIALILLSVLSEAMREYVQTARNAWPALEVPEEDFVRHASAHAQGSVPPIAHAADLYLAFACGIGAPGAIEAFDRAYANVAARVLEKRRITPDVADDVMQAIRERLFVGDRPKIFEYAGTGPLKSWVSTTIATSALMSHRAASRRREEPEPEEAELLARDAGPELRYMKERYKHELQGIIEGALSRLGARERTLLRLHLVERLSIDRIGTMYRVDRSTAARWINSARAQLIEIARSDARERLRLNASECESIAALVQSEIHVSIARLLG